MPYGCPSCQGKFEHKGDLQRGTHHERDCPHCGQLLQWDEKIVQSLQGRPISSLPVECSHRNRRKYGALVPGFFQP
jgi:hypothetical protein